MMEIFRYSFLLLVVLCFPCHAASTPNIEENSFTVVTYNLQTDDDMENEQQTGKFMRDNTKGLKEMMYTDPDVINLQEVPLGGIQWLEKNYGKEYKIVYAAKRNNESENKKNAHLVILYKKSRFEPMENENRNPAIKTRYYTDNSGNLLLMAIVRDQKTDNPISFVNTHVKNENDNEKVAEQVAEIIHLLHKYSFAVVTGDFNGTVTDNQLLKFAEYGYIHDPVTQSSTAKEEKLDHVLFKGTGKSKFISNLCGINTEIKGSDHYPLICTVYLQ
jgi:endonuclease/exonuclease/phosphatase family metal-dependent hydrolase